MAAISKSQTEIKLAHGGFILAWFCFLFMVHEMHLPHRSVAAWVFVVVCGFAAYSTVVGFVLRKRFFKQSTEVIPHNPGMANRHWRAANLLSFCSAFNLTICGAVLKYFGSDWLLPAIFFGLSLGFLLLWRPGELAVSGGQPA
jgi:hypothetical protein